MNCYHIGCLGDLCRNDENLLENIIAQNGENGKTDGAREIEKNRQDLGNRRKLEKFGNSWAMGKVEKIENWGGKIEKFSADRRAEWRKNRDGGGIETAENREKIEKNC